MTFHSSLLAIRDERGDVNALARTSQSYGGGRRRWVNRRYGTPRTAISSSSFPLLYKAAHRSFHFLFAAAALPFSIDGVEVDALTRSMNQKPHGAAHLTKEQVPFYYTPPDIVHQQDKRGVIYRVSPTISHFRK